MQHTLEIVRDYRGGYDATLLINCLLGLLVVPKESCFDSIPEDPIENLPNWGISSDSIKNFGNRKNANNLRGLVHSLRNSVAHFRFEPIPSEGEVLGFRFRDNNGFDAELKVNEMRQFVECLARHIHNN